MSIITKIFTVGIVCSVVALAVVAVLEENEKPISDNAGVPYYD